MLAILSVLVIAQSPAAADSKWEKEIAAIEKKIRDAKPGGVVFAGSSSIRLWDLKKSFPEMNAINCGFGGSEIRHSTQYAKRIIVPFDPAAIVFYAGDNDLGAKRKPEQLRDDFVAFVAEIRKSLPKTKILWLPVKPSVKRWNLHEQQKTANQLIKDIIDKDPTLAYVDLVPLHLGKDGKPEAKYFKEDGLHLNEAGYAKWNDAVKAALK